MNKEGKYSHIIDELINLTKNDNIYWIAFPTEQFKYISKNNDIDIIIDRYNLTVSKEICPVSGYKKFNELINEVKCNASRTQLNKVNILFKKFKNGL